MVGDGSLFHTHGIWDTFPLGNMSQIPWVWKREPSPTTLLLPPFFPSCFPFVFLPSPSSLCLLLFPFFSFIFPLFIKKSILPNLQQFHQQSFFDNFHLLIIYLLQNCLRIPFLQLLLVLYTN